MEVNYTIFEALSRSDTASVLRYEKAGVLSAFGTRADVKLW